MISNQTIEFQTSVAAYTPDQKQYVLSTLVRELLNSRSEFPITLTDEAANPYAILFPGQPSLPEPLQFLGDGAYLEELRHRASLAHTAVSVDEFIDSLGWEDDELPQ